MKHILIALALFLAAAPFAHAEGWVQQENESVSGVYGIDCGSGNVCLGVGADGSAIRTSDGKTWEAVSTGVSTYLNAVDMYTTVDAVAAGQSGVILITEDGGANWDAASSGTTETLHDVVMASSDIGFAVGNDMVIQKTTDGGQTWSATTGTLSSFLDVLTVDATSSLRAIIAGTNGVAYKTTTGGTSWTEMTTGTTSTIIALDMVSSTVAYIGTSSGYVAKTTDGTTFTALTGLTWETDEVVAEIGCTNSSICLIVGNKGSVYYTEDGGSTWEDWSINHSELYAFVNYAVGVRIAAGANGNVFRYDIYGPDEIENFGLSDGTATTTDTTPTFSWDEAVDDEGEVSTYEISMDGGDWVDVGDVTSYTWDEALSTDSHTALIRAIDTVDNEGAETEFIFTVGEDATDETDEDETEEDTGDGTTVEPEAEEGTLIKMECPGGEDVNDPCRAVYYYGADGKRHAFPNEKVYFTWYEDFDDVIEVSDEFMASLTLGRNVTYHPGTKMVKFQSVNTVYCVGEEGELRAIDSEETATDLYGSTWNQQIDDISDAFFSNYEFGVDIDSASDFDPDDVEASVDSIDDIL